LLGREVDLVTGNRTTWSRPEYPGEVDIVDDRRRCQLGILCGRLKGN